MLLHPRQSSSSTLHGRQPLLWHSNTLSTKKTTRQNPVAKTHLYPNRASSCFCVPGKNSESTPHGRQLLPYAWSLSIKLMLPSGSKYRFWPWRSHWENSRSKIAASTTCNNTPVLVDLGRDRKRKSTQWLHKFIQVRRIENVQVNSINNTTAMSAAQQPFAAALPVYCSACSASAPAEHQTSQPASHREQSFQQKLPPPDLPTAHPKKP
jgi:hypothetical protein